ncbi:MAG: histidine--tRNA ligase [Bdellovibrionaceae bacterium]|nr:histidine--tRNA ligase [Pseudobdellovibrionaceae bacterium]
MSSLKPVRGTHDLWGEDILKHLMIVEVARRMSANFGCQEIATPIFEFTQVFSRTLGDVSDIVNKEMYTFPDRGNDELTLRPEGTAGIARAFISEGMSQLTPLKFFYQGPMFRYERPQKGRQRQFHQLGVEFIGSPSHIMDIEVISLASVILNELGIKNYQLDINSIGDSESRTNYREALVQYLEKYKNDLSEDSKKRLIHNPMRILDSKDTKDQEIVAEAPMLSHFLNINSKTNFDSIIHGLENLNIGFNLNEKLVRGLDYYCHCVFEFKTQDLGAQDAILAGGRYDGLIELMGGPSTPAVGFAAGIERLALLCGKTLVSPRPTHLIPLGEAAEKSCVQICYQLRKENLLVDMSYSGNMSKRMKKANKSNAKYAIMIGDEELKKQNATVKNLDDGQQQTIAFSKLSDFLKTSKN